MAATLLDHILLRLTASGADQHPWSLLILAAIDGPDALTRYLAGTGTSPAPPKRARKAAASASAATAGTADSPAPEPPGVFLGAITIAGFRGIGPDTRLPLHAGPGLTLVVGRNGSGKSSFAEGVEVLLTGTSLRWHKRAKAWREGWRNLHQGDTALVAAELVVEGAGPLVAQRTWAAGADLTAGTATAKSKSGKATPLDQMGWAGAIDTFRPFLSYNELGSMLEDGPSKVYDALAPVLGLEEFVAVQASLTEARKVVSAHVANTKAAATALAQQAEQVVAAHPREARAVHLAALLKARAWDVAALRTLAEGGAEATQSVLEGLRRLAGITPPDAQAVQQAVNLLREAAAGLAATQGTDAARSLARARLLEQALSFHAAHDGAGDAGNAACPVCGSAGALDGDWSTRTREEIDALTAEASAARAAEHARDAALRAARGLVREVGPLPAASATELPSLHALREAQAMWLQARTVDAPEALAARLEAHVLDLAEASTRVAAEAAEELSKREDVWRPLGQALAAWLPAAEQLSTHKTQAEHLKAAEEWWKETTEAVRNERFQPIAARAMATWRQLRLQSNVDLGRVELEGTSTRRKVALQVTVDGKDAEALGVMSQGELHSLALSLFLPRATLPDSPFRFICVDDPVQSMDPARVEGLARVLADTARTRQVVVFTHDDRLPEAVRRLSLPARVLKVMRRAESVVEVVEARDPVSGYLDDARALVKTSELPAAVRARVVPGHCRLALEAACMTAVRQRRLRAGARHHEVEELLASHTKLYPLMALALFDDAERTGDVLPFLHKRNPRAADAFKGCNLGAHEAFDGDVEALVQDAERLADAVVRLGAK
ncbi:MAG: AAA family ATPase [Vicinamibacterales bacterium]